MEANTTSKPNEATPKYQDPPVTERIIAVQFEPLRHLKNAHLGAFWCELEADWSELKEVPALQPQYEGFGDQDRLKAVLRVEVNKEVSYRLQIRTNDRTRMIQLQNGKFHYHWLGPKRDSGYPDFQVLADEFRKYFDNFCSFVSKYELGEIHPDQWEVTYVNQIPKGFVWETPEDWSRVFKLPVSIGTAPASAKLESLESEWHYEILPQQGRLHVNLKHGRVQNKQEVLLLNLTTRGPIEQGHSSDAISKGVDLGHDTIVDAFRKLTSDEVQEHWGLYYEHSSTSE